MVDASLAPEPFVRLARVQGVWEREGGGMVVLGGQPGLIDAGLRQRGDPGETDVVVHVGDTHRPTPKASFRAHLGWFADPAMMLEPAGEVLVLPLLDRVETPLGTTTTSADRTARFSPQVLGHAPPHARSLTAILGGALRSVWDDAPLDTDAVRAKRQAEDTREPADSAQPIDGVTPGP